MRPADLYAGLPVNIDIRASWLVLPTAISNQPSDVEEADALPAVTGRVCPQETQCEGVCVLTKKFEPVAVGRLERFVAQLGSEKWGSNASSACRPERKKGGSCRRGPGRINRCRRHVHPRGHKVTIFEALHKIGRRFELWNSSIPPAKIDRKTRSGICVRLGA